jgi:hypothetical protein
MIIRLIPVKVLALLLSVIFLLLIMNVLGIISRLYLGHGHLYGLIRLFDFDTEQNIPTFFSSIILLISGILLALITVIHRKGGSAYVSWAVLAMIFLFLAIDEFSMIHERLSLYIDKQLPSTGPLYFGWILPYGAAVIVFAISYTRFLLQLPKDIMLLFIISGIVYVSGAIGFEWLDGRQIAMYGWNKNTYALLYTCEEFLEMLGIVLFIYSLLTYIVAQFESLTIKVTKAESNRSPGFRMVAGKILTPRDNVEPSDAIG